MHKYKKLLLCLLIAATSQTLAQNVGINTTTPDASAALEIKDTHKGLLIPRVHLQSVTDAITISSPAVSLLIYNTNPAVATGTGYYFNNGTVTVPAWKKFISTDDVDVAFAARSVSLPIYPDSTQVMPFTSEDFDVSNNFTLSSSFINPSTFTAPVKGIYHFDATITWLIEPSALVFTRLKVNGLTRIELAEYQDNIMGTHINSNVQLNAGDKVNITITHSSPNILHTLNCYFSGNILFRL
jgi:hypothetical protein